MKNLPYPVWGLLWAALATAHAAPVTWTTGPTETLNENDINLNGTLFHAGTWGVGTGAGPLTVPVGSQSITFENMTTGTAVGTQSAISTGGEYSDAGVWVQAGAADANFQNVMDGFASDGVNPKVIVVNGLVAGFKYQIQLFVSDDRGCCGGRTMEWSDNATDGTGAETATFAVNTSSYVIGTFTADGPTQTFYGRGVAQTQNYANAYVLRDLSPDTDGDGIPDHIEDTYDFLSKNNPADAALDRDSDGLSNLLEYQKRLNLQAGDADGDGLLDGAEVAAGTNPRVFDTDGDGLGDGAEVTTHGTNPLSVDSDGDLFRDGYEIRAGSLPTNVASTPNGATLSFLGVGVAPLLDSDLTDPENDGNDSTVAGAGFNWVTATASSKPDFQTTEGALNVFDNKVGGGEAKWCCDGAPQTVTVQFSTYTSLTHFTITSGDDAAERDPRVWEIQGSNDGTTFTSIIRFDDASGTLWSQRNQVMRVNLPATALPYKYIRYAVYATGGATHQLNELEYFGLQSNDDVDGDGIPKLYEDRFPAFLSDAAGHAADALADQDTDGLSNLLEFQTGTNPTLADSDGDGLNDGPEITAGTNPAAKDSDLDGLLDGDEVNVYHSNPLAFDSDGDGFRDKYEVDRGSDPALASSTPGGVKVEILGVGTTALLGHDFTDREDNGSDATAAGSGFDWVSATATNKPDFQASEGALNVFDNKVGGGEAKWCCDGINTNVPEQSITVRMPFPISLTHFTVTSSNDSPERDPRVWKIQGSNDGVTFTDIFVQGDATTSFWGDNRDQVIKFTLPVAAPQYTWFRYAVIATLDNSMNALGELEYFGIELDTDGDGMPDSFEMKYSLSPTNPADAGADSLDGDGLTNLEEYQNKTDPGDADTDNDGRTDGEEVKSATLTNPLVADTDGDGVRDGFEVAKGSDPNSAGSLPTFNPIDWATPAKITGSLTDFKTSGQLVHAWTGGASPVTVTGLGITFETGPFLGDRYTGYDPYNRGNDADYETLLNSGSYAGSLPKFVEIPGLTVGASYRIQVWVADTRSGASSGRVFTYGSYNLSNEFVDLHAGAAGDEGNFPGESVTGTFTATDTSQFMYIESSGFGSQYNAIMVHRETGIVEPLAVVRSAFNGTAFEITVKGLNTAKRYQLQRSLTLGNDFANVGNAFTPTNTTQTVSDPGPPAGKAFYIIKEVP